VTCYAHGIGCRGGIGDDAVPELRCRGPAKREVLRQMRDGAAPWLPGLWACQSQRGPLLLRVRCEPLPFKRWVGIISAYGRRRPRRCSEAARSGARREAPDHGPVLRHGRLDRALRHPRSGGAQGDPCGLSGLLFPRDRPLRGPRRPVHGGWRTRLFRLSVSARR
jgi:hypothetical protein